MSECALTGDGEVDLGLAAAVRVHRDADVPAGVGRLDAAERQRLPVFVLLGALRQRSAVGAHPPDVERTATADGAAERHVSGDGGAHLDRGDGHLRPLVVCHQNNRVNPSVTVEYCFGFCKLNVNSLTFIRQKNSMLP